LGRIEHVFMATNPELDHLRHDPDRFTALLAERWTQHRSLFDLEPPFSVNHIAPTMADMTHRSAKAVGPAPSGTVLTGTAGSGGVVTGRARVVLDPAHPDGLEPGDVLIAPQTDPSWVPLFVPAVGVVVNVGAMGSHAMIVSRELGIPCVVAVADATMLIADGVTVTVDGNAGTVTIH
jgi:rifampicin phosphotransferase